MREVAVRRPPAPARLRRLVAVLAVTQTIGYGVLHYAFPVLILSLADDLHTTKTVVAGAATVSVVAAGLVAIPIGRWLDRHGGRWLMTAGSLLGVLGMLAWSQVTAVWQLYAVLAVLGVALAASTYDAAFAVLVAAAPPERRRAAMLSVTVVAGFASSIFFPLTGVLVANLGWRAALLILAALLAVTTVPAHARAVPDSSRGRPTVTEARRGMPPAVHDPGFWLTTAAFVVHSAAVATMGLLLVTHLTSVGLGVALASSVSGLLGVLSVTGRVLTTGLSHRLGMTTVTAGVFLVQAAGAAVLPYADRFGGIVACVVAFGLGFGVATIARPAILVDRYGTSAFATTAAVMTVPMTAARALAPVGAAALGSPAFLSWVAAACAVAAVLLGALRFVPPRTPVAA